jgi:hypothetical protein
MSWSEVGGMVRFIKPAQCACDDVLVEGKYLGKAKNDYGEYHKFQQFSGENVAIRGGHLDFLISQGVKEGQEVKVVYKGEHTLEDGKFKGKPTHRFQVFTKPEENDDGEEVDFDFGE